MDYPLTNLSIPVKRTQDWLKEWKNENATSAKAFLIPASEIVTMFIEMGVIEKDEKSGIMTVKSTLDQGIRAYMGINPELTGRDKNEGYGNKLYVVGTKKVGDIHKDIVEGNTGVDLSNMSGTGVFDFIKPCPNNCDITSPLYTLK